MRCMIADALADNGSHEVAVSICGTYAQLERDVPTVRSAGRDDWHIILVQRGVMDATLAGEARVLRDGDMLLYPPYAPQNYMYHAGADTAYFWLHFRGTAVPEMMAQFGFSEGVFHLTDSMESIAAFYALLEASPALPGALYVQNARLQLLLTTLGRAARESAPTRYSDRIADIAAGMRAAPEQLCSNAELAAVCGISEYHFIRVFKAETGFAPQKYRTLALLEKGKRLLRNTVLPIGDIAAALGFHDPLYFSRLFRSTYGVSPGKYRATAP